MRELKTAILIVGGGTGGCAAALACARMGVPCILVEPADWIGGQLTTQAVPPDENRWIETCGGNRTYQELRASVRMYYRRVRGGLVPEAAAQAHLNPGGGWVSRLCAEPRVWHDVLSGMLVSAGFEGLYCPLLDVLELAQPRVPGAAKTPADSRSGMNRAVLLAHEILDVEVIGDRVRAVRFVDSRSKETLTIEADLILDASETGELLERAGVEHAIGAEHQDVYGELHGRADFRMSERSYDWLDQQPCSWCFALEHRLGERHVIDRPARYDWWRSYVPEMSPPWCGPLFSWTVPSHTATGCRTFRLVPWPDEPDKGELELWRYRRIADASIYVRSTSGAKDVPPRRDPDERPEPPPARVGSGPTDVSLINVVQMDYWQRPLLGVSAAERAIAVAGSREQSLCWLYWMQTEAPRHDGRGLGYPGLRLRGDELGTADGFAKQPYIREPRRLIARTIVTEAHIGTQQRREAGWDRRDPNWSRVEDGGADLGTAEPFQDSVGIGHYMIDLHPSCAGRNNLYVPAAPFRIPMGSLIPVRVRNVLAAGKCLGVTHITNGAYRMHHVEWNVGEAAGILAAYCVCERVHEPGAIHADPARVRNVQRVLGEHGARLAWPWEQ